MKITTKIVADIGRLLARLDRVLPEARADGALLDDGQLAPAARRRAAGSTRSLTCSHREAAGDLAGAAGDRRTGCVGAEITLLSSTMASGRPIASVVAWPKRCAPRMLKRKLTIGSLVRLSKAGCASTDRSPSTMTRRSTGTRLPPSSLHGQHVHVGRARLARAGGIRASPCVPRISFRRCGSCRPGTCTRMRSAPWRWMFGSVVPSDVDAAAEHLDGLVDGAADLLVRRRPPYR